MDMGIDDFSMDFFSLKGKTAIVTGGNSGLGLAFSTALAKAGADLFIPSYVMDNGEARHLIEKQGVEVEMMEVDITEKGAPQSVLDKCLARFGKVDVLFNNAGICINKPVLEFGRAAWDPMIAINLTAAFELSHEAAKVMIPQKSGKMINTCSLYSYLGGQGSSAYTASKHGIAGLTKAYCDELAQYNIQVNGIAPGYFATELTEQTRSNPERNREIVAHIPTNRWGDLQDLMGTAVFLSSRASDYVNGQILAVDGGYLVR